MLFPLIDQTKEIAHREAYGETSGHETNLIDAPNFMTSLQQCNQGIQTLVNFIQARCNAG
ncbi:hypothetical protein CKA32_001159 [Geitlerinema sp. FC II]|nr:hypothetical protein CKA32_001159 [Geitlerinema sp. FC II]